MASVAIYLNSTLLRETPATALDTSSSDTRKTGGMLKRPLYSTHSPNNRAGMLVRIALSVSAPTINLTFPLGGSHHPSSFIRSAARTIFLVSFS
mmetsp:Transcript_1789/g.4936  ORF Transcript_1789/g.4936 Transcript_1789/m.4936 type:complete len:94 (-) Transcript_1789:3494-3775(-)